MLGNCHACGDFKEVKKIDTTFLSSTSPCFSYSYNIKRKICFDCDKAMKIVKKLDKKEYDKNLILQQKIWKKQREAILKKEIKNG